MEKFLVEISARHMHLSQQHVEILFGEGHQLHPIKDLSQPGQYACEERVEIVGPKGTLVARILGPTRSKSQVEVSLTDARTLGVEVPIRESGHTQGSSSILLRGPKGEVLLPEGLIAAKRHIHMHPKDAAYYGVENGQIVAVKIDSEERSLILDDTVIRVSESFSLAMHIDTDEANAAGLKTSGKGEIIVF